MTFWSFRRRIDSPQEQDQPQHHQEQHVGLSDLTDYEAAVEDTFLIKSNASSSSSSHDERKKPFLWAREVRMEEKDSCTHMVTEHVDGVHTPQTRLGCIDTLICLSTFCRYRVQSVYTPERLCKLLLMTL